MTESLARARDNQAGNVRATLGTLADELDPARLRTWLDEALAAEKDAWVSCPDCRHRIPIKTADWSARAKVLEVFLNQGKGTAPKAVEAPKAGGQVVDMSDAELEALLDAQSTA